MGDASDDGDGVVRAVVVVGCGGAWWVLRLWSFLPFHLTADDGGGGEDDGVVDDDDLVVVLLCVVV